MVYQHFDCIDYEVINRFVPPSSPKNYRIFRPIARTLRITRTPKLFCIPFEVKITHT
jgi:hypothetical protein